MKTIQLLALLAALLLTPLATLLADPAAPWTHAALTTFGRGNHAVLKTALSKSFPAPETEAPDRKRGARKGAE